MEDNLKCKICGCILVGVIILPNLCVCKKCYLGKIDEPHTLHRSINEIELVDQGMHLVDTSGSSSVTSFEINNDFNKN